MTKTQSDEQRQWMPRDQWNTLRAGDNDLARYANAPYHDVLVTNDGFTVADLERSRLILKRNQYVQGYCVLVAKSSVAEPHHMRPPERQLYFEDLMLAAEAIEKVFQPIKMNFKSLGNVVPHLHFHIIPRYENDPAPNADINPEQSTVYLSRDDYEQMVGDIREAMGFIRVRVNDPHLVKFLDNQGRVLDWPSRKHQDSQMAVRFYLADKFEYGRRYTEKEVNAIMNTWALFDDWALLRRELVMYNLFQREKDGTAYWRVNDDEDET